MQLKRNKKRYPRYALRTDTQPVALHTFSDGTKYIERKDGSLIPKPTSVAVTESVKRLLKWFKDVGGYPSINEVILELLLTREEAESFPTKMIEKAEYDSGLQRDAREKAIRKGRYKKVKAIDPAKYAYRHF